MSSSGSSIRSWLATHPRDGEILDRLRQGRRLPEKADYRDWKKSWLASYGSNCPAIEDQWHLPDGRTLHVVADSDGAKAASPISTRTSPNGSRWRAATTR